MTMKGIRVKRGIVKERILRVLLNNPDEGLTKYRIAKLSNGTFSWVHEFLGFLEKHNMIKVKTEQGKSSQKILVSNFSKLLFFWQQCMVKPRKREYMVRDPIEILKNTKLKYALTTFQAENLIQNYLFVSRVDLYIRPKDEKKWHNLLAMEGLVGKGNTRLLIKDEHVFYNAFRINELSLVTLPQLIVDLLDEGGVCIEAAEQLLKRGYKYAIPKL